MDFFFFQAEDGIRDYKVTGVQTCALPICVLMGTGPVPQVDEAGMRYTRNGLILKTEDASGRWTGYYQVDYATFFQGRLFAPSAGLVLALLLSLLAGIAYTRWFNRKVIAPAQEAQRVIVESNQFNRTLIETAPVAVCLVAYGSGKIIFSNSLVQEWLHSACAPARRKTGRRWMKLSTPGPQEPWSNWSPRRAERFTWPTRPPATWARM